MNVKSVAITTGKPDGSDRLDSGSLEISEDGKAFATWRSSRTGRRSPSRAGRRSRRSGSGRRPRHRHPLAIREIALDSEPKVAPFRTRSSSP